MVMLWAGLGFSSMVTSKSPVSAPVVVNCLRLAFWEMGKERMIMARLTVSETNFEKEEDHDSLYVLDECVAYNAMVF
ncbi:hypothetical protein G4B88_002197 [Cannabis sativa]|uniref:Uncharacterized protein n=1 Tax=Cannabis sativa TaxID=3483 RepID=A0A7J6G1D0_CANSA|nr:hypothetical protein G4B88_002197 [Cannabis sativa]